MKREIRISSVLPGLSRNGFLHPLPHFIPPPFDGIPASKSVGDPISLSAVNLPTEAVNEKTLDIAMGVISDWGWGNDREKRENFMAVLQGGNFFRMVK
ncbi:hypothetical protein TNCT_379321 [Trichonephila clavata]|uniref:Uncharacterized protein n=1 Tax=Trichonephila clavata TaxID=2740835 RepID=A0A8X6M2T7_TRICU|nr:hypothetical protein TNCT_379321 [Trichonephila clavata]